MLRRLALITALLSFATPALASDFDLTWHTIDDGGGTSAGGSFTLSGTIGQPDAGPLSMPMAGGSFSLAGGFWAATAAPAPRLRGDMNCDGAMNNFDIDPFVLALLDPASYAALYPGCSTLNGDINRDGALNNFDIDPFVACVVAGGCP